MYLLDVSIILSSMSRYRIQNDNRTSYENLGFELHISRRIALIAFYTSRQTEGQPILYSIAS